MKKDLSFEQLIELYNHIGEEERHFNTIELEYRKLTSQWLLVSLGAIGFVLTKENLIPVNAWVLVIAICVACSIGILVLWLLDIKVYHELLHSAFKEGVLLEKEYPQYLPQVRTNMVKSQASGDIIKRVMLYYFYSVLLLIVIANISIWMYDSKHIWLMAGFNILSAILIMVLYKVMTNRTNRLF